MKRVFLGILVILPLASCVTIINEPKPAATGQTGRESPQVRGALSGRRQILVSFYANAADCTSLGDPTLKVAVAPKHGKVSIEQGTALADFGDGDARKACNGQTVPATVIYYTSDEGFVGEDSAAFERIGVRGAYGYHVYTINVR